MTFLANDRSLYVHVAHCLPPDAVAEPDQIAARALIERQIAVLTRLTDIGMEIAETAGRLAAAALQGRIEPGLTFARVSRAIRMTIALQSRLLAHLAALDHDAGLAGYAASQKRRLRAERLVEQAIEAEHDDDGYEVERLSDEARERMDDEEAFGDLLSRPIEEIVARICRDRGFEPDWSACMARGWVAGPPDQEPDTQAAPPDGPAGGEPPEERVRQAADPTLDPRRPP